MCRSVIVAFTGSSSVFDWLKAANLHVEVSRSLRDGERYVRATGIKAMMAMLQWLELWEDCVASQVW
jgi:hypothetical protein